MFICSQNVIVIYHDWAGHSVLCCYVLRGRTVKNQIKRHLTHVTRCKLVANWPACRFVCIDVNACTDSLKPGPSVSSCLHLSSVSGKPVCLLQPSTDSV